jgi:hypothetical protein
MIIVLTNRKGASMADPKTSSQALALDQPERRWSDSQLAAVVEAAYILDALAR